WDSRFKWRFSYSEFLDQPANSPPYRFAFSLVFDSDRLIDYKHSCTGEPDNLRMFWKGDYPDGLLTDLVVGGPKFSAFRPNRLPWEGVGGTKYSDVKPPFNYH